MIIREDKIIKFLVYGSESMYLISCAMTQLERFLANKLLEVASQSLGLKALRVVLMRSLRLQAYLEVWVVRGVSMH